MTERLEHPWLRHGFTAEQHMGEFVPFLRWLEGRRVERVLEIGVRHGGTAATWCEMVKERPRGIVVGVDWPEKDGLGWDGARDVDDRLTMRYPDHYLSVFGDSHTLGVFSRVKDYAPFDLLFVDGDHSAAGCAGDFADYGPMVRSGGVVAFHDIVDTDLTRRVNCRVCEVWRRVRSAAAAHVEFSVGGDWGGIGAMVMR